MSPPRYAWLGVGCAGVVLFGAACLQAQPAQNGPAGKPEDTEQWAPTPGVVTPGRVDAAPPSDALMLFDGSDLRQWVSTSDKSPARWTVSDGVLTVNKQAGNIETKRSFRDYQLHLEWRVPEAITGSGQGRGNSGVFLASTGPGDAGYELQILDSYANATYTNGQAGSIYKQHPPLVNANRKPGEWQSYDVIWTAPVFAANGAVSSPARVTVLHNGVLVQNNAVLAGETRFIGRPTYTLYDRAPIKLQAHGDSSPPLSFRNIWVRELGPQPPSAAANILTTAERAQGWRLLFDGKDLDGWRAHHRPQVPPQWRVEDGALTTIGGADADLMTVDEFGEFELAIDWKIAPRGNSGIMFLVKDTPAAVNTYNTGPEIQVLDDNNHPDGRLPSHRAGSLYDLVAATPGAVHPVGEWNQSRIIVQKGRIESWLNGQKVAEASYGDDAWRAMVAGSKFKTMPLFGMATSGHIALQDHGDRVWYRNIKIRKL